MSYCGPRGIPHSHFLGGPVEWTPLDRHKAIWWMLREAEKCPSCGTRPAEWDPAQGGQMQPYIAVQHRCWGCVTTASAQDQLDEDEPGLSIRLQANTGPDPSAPQVQPAAGPGVAPALLGG